MLFRSSEVPSSFDKLHIASVVVPAFYVKPGASAENMGRTDQVWLAAHWRNSASMSYIHSERNSKKKTLYALTSRRKRVNMSQALIFVEIIEKLIMNVK